MISSARMAMITEQINALGAAHKLQPVDMKLFGICCKGWGFTGQEIEFWQAQGGFNLLTPEAQQMFRDIWGDQKFAP